MGGLRILAESDITIFRETNVDHPVDAVEITYLAPQGTEALLLWHVPGTPDNEVLQLPVMLAAAVVPTTKKIDTSWYKEWVRKPKMLGLRVPKGTDIQIMHFRLRGWNMFDRAWNAVQSYWTFDVFSPYSVNFLWGPILSGSPIARESLYLDLPPHGTYANSVWYVVLLVMGVIALAAGKMRKRAQALGAAFVILLCALWLLSDIRMGSEVLSYVWTDFAGHNTVHPQKEQFRERGNFLAFAGAAAPLVTDRGRYVFLTQYPYPFLGLMRYHTYPSLPVGPEAVTEGIDTWVVFARGDVGVDAEGRLTSEGKVVSAPGRILLDFAPDSFVFRTGT